MTDEERDIQKDAEFIKQKVKESVILYFEEDELDDTYEDHFKKILEYREVSEVVEPYGWTVDYDKSYTNGNSISIKLNKQIDRITRVELVLEYEVNPAEPEDNDGSQCD